VLGQIYFAPSVTANNNNNKQTTSEEQMKFNKWTLGLAAVGAVSLASAARADEAKMSQVQTALSNTTISGYVSSSMNWTIEPNKSGAVDNANAPAGNIPLQRNKQNGFNLDVVKLSVSKPQDTTPWSAGYQADLLFGPDAVGWNPSQASSANLPPGTTAAESDFAIQQAYVALDTPLGNGIEWKVGVFNNSIVGYEVFDAGNNWNYTRSWAWSVEPTEFTGVLGTYQFTDEFSVAAGVANTLSSGINMRDSFNASNGRDWHKSVMGRLTYKAPSNWGWLAGSDFYAGMVWGWFNDATEVGGAKQDGDQINYFLGATLTSPWKNVTFGASFDYVQNLHGGDYTSNPAIAAAVPGIDHINDYILGLYNRIEVPDTKLSFNSRIEYWYVDTQKSGGSYDNGVALTETMQYDIWENVVSRLELRYDKATKSINSDGVYILPNGTTVDTTTGGKAGSWGLYANLIYKF
jgi:hypothetical protein